MTVLHVFTEEPSLKKVFDVILPKILQEQVLFRIYPHQGKQDLEKALRNTIPTISKIPGSKILITRDQDDADCKKVKSELNDIIKDNCHCDYSVRIVCRELESWFIGDLKAIESAFPRFRASQFEHKSRYRDVDNITKPSAELLKLIPEYSKRKFLPKLEISEKIAEYMNPESNKSKSFINTIAAIKKMAGVHSN
jgi:hypothetical protein